MASRSKTDLHPDLVKAYDKAAEAWAKMHPTEPQPFLTCTYRSNEEQDHLYAQGRTVVGSRVTNAKAGQSAHNYYPSLAFDIAFIDFKKQLNWGGELFRRFAVMLLTESKGITWGGNFQSMPDKPHFELTAWKALKK